MKTKQIAHFKPEIERHSGVTVVKDTVPGGTKARYAWQLFLNAHEVIYASSPEGGAQVSLAHCAQRWGRRCTIFAAARQQLHPRQIEAQRLGARYEFIRPGYLNVVQSRARAYAQKSGGLLAPWGMKTDNAIHTIAEAAQCLKIKPDVVWAAAGSGTLANGLRLAWPAAEMHIVEVGAAVEVLGTIKHTTPYKYSQRAPTDTVPFSVCPHYEAKAYHVMQAWLASRKPSKARILFWVPMPGAAA